MSVHDAFKKYSNKQIKKTREKRRPRTSPEKDVEKEVLAWARKWGFDLTVVDSGHMRHERTKVSEYGFADLCGNTPDGIGAFVELKAPYQKRMPSVSQYLFIKRKIESGCFAIITDSASHMAEIYVEWLALVDANKRKLFLLKNLKVPRNVNASSIDDSPLF